MSVTSPTYREILREIAYGSHGYVAAGVARAAGVPHVELAKLAHRGGLEHVAYGLYRFPDIPGGPEAQFAEAVLRAGPRAFLRGESVLALLGLGHVNPRKITVGTTMRVRRNFPHWMEVTRADPSARITRYEGIAAQDVMDAIGENIGRVPAANLREAARQARDGGWLSQMAWNRLRRMIPRDV